MTIVLRGFAFILKLEEHPSISSVGSLIKVVTEIVNVIVAILLIFSL